jgi:hypothetical protein
MRPYNPLPLYEQEEALTTWAVIMVNPSTAAGLFSPCGLYRYRLERLVGIDDGQENDPTIRKVLGFAQRGNAENVIVGNKFAFRATDIKALRSASDPIGPENDQHLEQIMRDADFHLVAWGPLAKLPPRLRGRYLRVAAIARQVGCKLHCLGTAQDGHPLHPLMQPYSSELREWSPR